MSGTRIVNRRDGTERLQAKADNGKPLYIEVVPGGKRTYLWIGGDTGSALLTVSGRATLRRLAQCILDELGETHDD